MFLPRLILSVFSNMPRLLTRSCAPQRWRDGVTAEQSACRVRFPAYCTVMSAQRHLVPKHAPGVTGHAHTDRPWTVVNNIKHLRCGSSPHSSVTCLDGRIPPLLFHSTACLAPSSDRGYRCQHISRPSSKQNSKAVLEEKTWVAPSFNIPQQWRTRKRESTRSSA